MGRRKLTAEEAAARGSAKKNPARYREPDGQGAAPAKSGGGGERGVAPARDYAAIAEGYARDVVEGRIPACKWVKLACRRHLSDLERQGAEGFPYVFRPEIANRFCAALERYPHIKGKWVRTREKLRLEPWQTFSTAVPFGWVRKDPLLQPLAEGEVGPPSLRWIRRFRKMLMMVPRKNAKSTLAAAIGNNMLLIDGEPGAEVYAGATSEAQAHEVFGPARLMLEKAPELLEEFGVEVYKKSIVRTEDLSRFMPIIGKPGDGASPHCSIHDEYHEHDAPDQVDAMETGMGAREQPMLIIITTAGTNLASPCFDEFESAKKILEGVFESDEIFAIMYSIDEEEGKKGDPDYRPGDDWADPAVLEKANPNIGVSVERDFLLAQQREAIRNPAKMNRFKTKHLNVWCASAVAGISISQWKACADLGLTIDEFAGEECWPALDLASKIDLCAYVRLFVRMIGGHRHYYAFPRCYLPERTIEDTRYNQQAYQKWVAQGHLIATPGAEVNFDELRDDVIADASRYQFREIVYDPWRATQLAHQLAAEGATVVEMGQTARNMAEAFDEFTSALKAGRFHHDGNPLYEWQASNVVARSVAKGMTMPGRDKPQNKIDAIIATIMAIARAMVDDGAGDGEADALRNPVIVEAR